MSLPVFDVAVVVVYLVGLLAFGMFFSRFVRTEKDYFLAGRGLPFWAIGMSIVVSDIGAIDFVSLSGASYKYGIAAANMDWIGTMPAIILAAFVFIPYYWRAGVYSVPEFLGRRYSGKVRGIQSLAWTLFLVVNLGAIFWATAGMFETLLGPELWDPWIPADAEGSVIQRKMLYVVIAAVFTGAYTVSGGLAAVVYTDAVQLVVMFAGALIILAIGLYHPEKGVGGLTGLQEAIASGGHTDHFTLFLPHDTETPFPWTGVLLGLALVQAPAYFMGNQAIVQRTLGARDEWASKAGTLFGGLLKCLIPLLVVVPGLLALALFPGLEDADTVYPRLVVELLPVGLRGIVFAGFLAAMMSSVDSVLTSAATLITRDLLVGMVGLRPSDRGLLLTGRGVTLGLVVFGVLMARTLDPDFGFFSGIYEAIQHILAIIQGPTWALLLLGVFWRGATAAGGLVALVSGLIASVGLTLWQKTALAIEAAASATAEEAAAGEGSILVALWQALGGGDALAKPFTSADPFMFIAAISFAVTALTLVLVSLGTRRKPPEELRGLVFGAAGREAAAQDALRERGEGEEGASEEGEDRDPVDDEERGPGEEES